MFNQSLPIYSFREQILAAVAENPVTIVHSDTGTGKSTQVAQYLLKAGWRALITEPRRLAARTVAERVAEEYGTAIGNVVGYRTAMERKHGPRTRCLFVTDGIAMINEIMGHGNHDVLIIDEVHEWSIEIETLIAWAKLQISKGVDYKVVLMSATFDAQSLSRYFDGAPIIEVPGRQFYVETQSPTGDDMVDDVIRLLRNGLNVQVFVAGKPEIDETILKLKRRGLNAEILPLHGNLTPEDQAKCFTGYNRPKCVVSTNVAQTSVTIPDIDAVVDSGMERQLEIRNGIEGLYLGAISLADRGQRMGRAGRTRPGIYIDWCPTALFDRPLYPKPAILRTRLDMTVLKLAVAGYDVEELEFFHQPTDLDFMEARRTLRMLGCLDSSGKVTKVGRIVSRLPVSPHLGRMIVEADKLGVLDDVVTIAAIMETDGLVNQTCPSCRQLPGKKNCTCWTQWINDPQGSDHIAMLELYKACQDKSKDEMKKIGVNLRAYFLIRDLRSNIVRALDRKRFHLKSSGNRTDILRAVCAGMVDQLYEDELGTYVNEDDVERRLCHGSIAHGLWVVGRPWDLQYQGRHGKRVLNLLRMASGVDPLWVAEAAPHLTRVEQGPDVWYDHLTGTWMSLAETYLDDRLIDSRPVPADDQPDALPDGSSGGDLQWQMWDNAPELDVPDIDNLEVEIPRIVEAQYGTHAVLGHPLMAYAFLTNDWKNASELDSSYTWVWTRNRAEAVREHAKFVAIASAAREAHRLYLEAAQAQEKSRIALDQESAAAWDALREGTRREAELLIANAATPATAVDVYGLDTLVATAIQLRDEAAQLCVDHESVLSGDTIDGLRAVDVDDSEMPSDWEAIQSFVDRARQAISAAQVEADAAMADAREAILDAVSVESENVDQAAFEASLKKLVAAYAK